MDKNIIIKNALKCFDRDKIPNKIPYSLPIVEDFCSKKLRQKIFVDMDVLFIQHHLGPFIPRIRAMMDYGLDISNCWFVDIPYSTNNLVCKELRKMDCPKKHMSKPFNDPIAPYSRRQIERVEHVIKQLASKDKTRILVIDDGAYFIRALNHLKKKDKKLVKRLKNRTFIVEQTTRGHRYLEKEDGQKMLTWLNIPVVSIARADTKYDLESPFIGAAVAQGIINALTENGRLADGLGCVLIIGFGPVGKATTKRLKELKLGKSIDVYDVKKSVKKEIEATGATALEAFPKKGSYNTVFGCTGYASINTVKKLKVLADNALLVSGSSAAIEFNRERFIDRAYRQDMGDFFIIDPENARRDGIRAEINMNLDDKKFSFIHAGFPVNFDGSIECIPSQIIQLTHCMLIAASQETLGKKHGLHHLNKADDNWIYSEGLNMLKLYGRQ